jgi:hypothetical protein
VFGRILHFISKELNEEKREFNPETHLAFVEFEKAFDGFD